MLPQVWLVPIGNSSIVYHIYNDNNITFLIRFSFAEISLPIIAWSRHKSDVDGNIYDYMISGSGMVKNGVCPAFIYMYICLYIDKC